MNKNKLTISNVVSIYLSANEFDEEDLKDLKAVKEAAKDFIFKSVPYLLLCNFDNVCLEYNKNVKFYIIPGTLTKCGKVLTG